ncbi:hypothetical protein H6789_01290 [Candidatus Nomurabacteria bacterium]|nr:hypothetical protein [Candidatus Nomurabacteria bacterium]
MFLFGGSDKDTGTLGVVLDISDAIVNIGIVISKEEQSLPEIVWSHQEKVTATDSLNNTESRLMVSLLNAFTELGNSGFVSLRKKGINKLPSLIQVAITAPLAYTVSRTVSVSSDKPFKVTQKLFDELEKKAGDEARKLCESQLMTKDLDLEMLANSTVSLTVNGYPTHYPFKSTATEVKLCQMITLSSKVIVAELNKLKNKILPEADIDIDSFMSIYFRAVLEVAPNTTEACFINSTLKGAELMVMRESLPVSSTYVAVTATGGTAVGALPAATSSVLLQDLTTLFKNTGDGLSLPKRLYLHSNVLTESSLVPLLESASKAATGVTHKVHQTTTEFFSPTKSGANSLACSAYVFHKKLYEDRYLDESLNMLKYA